MTEQKNTATVMVKDGQSRDDEETKMVAASNVAAAVATADLSPQSVPTLRDVFQVPEKTSDKGTEHWQAFQDKLEQEAKGIKLTALRLKVQKGAICEIQPGSCEAKGTIKYEKLPIAEKKLSPIKSPLMIKIPNLFSTAEAADKDATAGPGAKEEAPSNALSSN